MEKKCALIVDDSHSARVVLRKLLEEHDLEVATAESAEQALEYLQDSRPDVIFMDHMMPGMDGFEAVQAIKNNPDTATIPIMMYTSQEGELYVGQARALGAVGVLPKQVAPVEVSKVLESLRLIETGAGRESSDSQRVMESTGDTTADLRALSGLDTGLREMIQDLFEQQRSIIRRDLIDSYESIAARVAEEIGGRRGDTEDVTAEIADSRTHLPRTAIVATVVLALAALTFAWLYIKAERQWQAERAQSQQLLSQLRGRQNLVADGTVTIQERLSATQQGYDAAVQQALAAVEWALNRDGTYSWDEMAFGEERRFMLEELLDRLDAIGFRGQVRLVSHVGDFCLKTSDADGLRLAPPDTELADCDRLGFLPEEARSWGARQSVSFANFLSTLDARYGGAIRVDVATAGNLEPVLPYPSLTGTLTAGEWNRIAAANNRVRLELLSD